MLLAELQILKSNFPDPFIISADSNAHHFSWGSEVVDSRGRLINDWVNNNDINILNSGEPTFLSVGGTYTHIDLTLCSQALQSLNWDIESDTYHSDHFPIIVSDPKLGSGSEAQETTWNLKTADWTGYATDLQLEIELKDPSQACNSLTTSICQAASKNIQRRYKQDGARYTKTWWNTDCNKATKDKNNAYNKYKKNLGNLELWIEYKKAKATARRAILQAKKDNWHLFLSNMTVNTSSSEVWRKVRMLRKPVSPKPMLFVKNGIKTTKAEDIANILVDMYSSRSDGTSEDVQFTQHKTVSESIPLLIINDNEDSMNRDFDEEDLNRALSSCKSKSAGPDGIPYDMIKRIPDSQTGHLLNFYNYVWQKGLPEQWREAFIIPIHKQGKPTSIPSSYRPIAITNCLCKVLEKMVNFRLRNRLESKMKYDSHQSGFRTKHSTLDPISRIEDSIRTSLINCNICLAIFLDIEQAFDTVWHYGLLKKLVDMGIEGNMLNFIREYLSNRVITVKVNDKHSTRRLLHAGVPQGSAVSPTLFNVMINDIFKDIPKAVQYSLYADDGAMWLTCDNLKNGLHLMQEALNSISQWSHKWGMKLAPQKTKAMIFTKQHVKRSDSLEIDGVAIEFVSKYKFLGVTLDRHLTWGPHIAELSERCQADIRLMRTVSANGWGADKATLQRLYYALLRSKIDYASFLYDTAAKGHLKKTRQSPVRRGKNHLRSLKMH